MEVRQEVAGDVEAVRRVHNAAFAHPEFADTSPPEVALADELRDSPEFIPALSLVAVVGSEVVGHVMSTRATIGPKVVPVLGLGPLGVHPTHQRQGAGSALVQASIRVADELGEPMIVLLGNPAYYSRFGFELSANFGIEPPEPDWAPHFQVRPGRNYDTSVRGAFTYAEPFSRL